MRKLQSRRSFHPHHSARVRAKYVGEQYRTRTCEGAWNPSASEKAATPATFDRGNVAAVADVAAFGDGAIIRDNGEDGGFVL